MIFTMLPGRLLHSEEFIRLIKPKRLRKKAVQMIIIYGRRIFLTKSTTEPKVARFADVLRRIFGMEDKKPMFLSNNELYKLFETWFLQNPELWEKVAEYVCDLERFNRIYVEELQPDIQPNKTKARQKPVKSKKKAKKRKPQQTVISSEPQSDIVKSEDVYNGNTNFGTQSKSLELKVQDSIAAALGPDEVYELEAPLYPDDSLKLDVTVRKLATKLAQTTVSGVQSPLSQHENTSFPAKRLLTTLQSRSAKPTALPARPRASRARPSSLITNWKKPYSSLFTDTSSETQTTFIYSHPKPAPPTAKTSIKPSKRVGFEISPAREASMFHDIADRAILNPNAQAHMLGGPDYVPPWKPAPKYAADVIYEELASSNRGCLRAKEDVLKRAWRPKGRLARRVGGDW